MNLAFVRLSKRNLNLFLFPALLLVCGLIILVTRHAPAALFYRTGLFVRYHAYMTPDPAPQGVYYVCTYELVTDF